jgi:hypothetical protein
MEWGIYSYFWKMVDEIEITLFLCSHGPFEFFWVKEFCKYLLFMLVVLHNILPISWVSLSPWLKKCNIYNTLFVIEFDPMTSLLWARFLSWPTTFIILFDLILTQNLKTTYIVWIGVFFFFFFGGVFFFTNGCLVGEMTIIGNTMNPKRLLGDLIGWEPFSLVKSSHLNKIKIVQVFRHDKAHSLGL